MAIRVSISGLDSVSLALGGGQAKIKEALYDATEYLRDQAIERSPVDTGAFRASWGSVEDYAGGFTFRNYASYAGILETGGYKSVGPRTVILGGRIYSDQAPGGIIGPMVKDKTIVAELNQKIRSKLQG